MEQRVNDRQVNASNRGRRKAKKPTEERLTRSAVHYLERYSSSEDNLRKVLQRKVLRAARELDLNPADFQDMIDSVAAKAVRSGMVNDTAFAETRIVRERRRGRSTRQIEARLRAKGIKADTLQTALAQDHTDDRQAARTAARRKRLGPWRRCETQRRNYRDKDIASLCRAGFPFSIAKEAIDAILTDNSMTCRENFA